jgi:hypothetical protein
MYIFGKRGFHMPITQVLQQSVSTILSPLFEKMYSHDVDVTHFGSPDTKETLKVKVQQTKDKLTDTLVLQLVISHTTKKLHLSNIFIPINEHNKGYGFGLLHEIRTVANANGYKLFIVDMVPSFYKRMLSKGAKAVVGVKDAVLVDDETVLLSHRS